MTIFYKQYMKKVHLSLYQIEEFSASTPNLGCVYQLTDKSFTKHPLMFRILTL